jgi:hypothetical protein
MGEQIAEHEELLNETQEVQIKEDITPETENVVDTPKKAKIQFTKKKIIIIAAAVVAVIAVALVLFIPSKFERVRSECLQIAGRVTGHGDYFMIDTYPDDFENMDPVLVSMLLRDTQSDALEAIRYANKELGFNGSVYSRMLETTALMGRQSEENDKYKVSWTYHPDDGLEVTYEKKH